MHAARKPRIVCLSNVYDQRYHDQRAEDIPRCLSIAKRRGLFHCLELATSREVLVLSVPPKAAIRRAPKWLASRQTEFSHFTQIFCGNWDAPKLRVPLSWIFYAAHVLRHTRTGDIVVLDNYELVYVIAAWFLRPFRRVRFVLDYEDGKHLIDRGWSAFLSGMAESIGRPLMQAAILAHPALGARLPRNMPTESVPGFITSPPPRVALKPTAVQFIYAGSLDEPRGVRLLLAAIQQLPIDLSWGIHISGAGPLESEVREFARQNSRVIFHGTLSDEPFAELLLRCDVGLNCQRASDPISAVTFPSKVFTYLSHGLLVLSSRASGVSELCGAACIYYENDSPDEIARALKEIAADLDGARAKVNVAAASKFTIDNTAARLKKLFDPLLQ